MKNIKYLVVLLALPLSLSIEAIQLTFSPSKLTVPAIYNGGNPDITFNATGSSSCTSSWIQNEKWMFKEGSSCNGRIFFTTTHDVSDGTYEGKVKVCGNSGDCDTQSFTVIVGSTTQSDSSSQTSSTTVKDTIEPWGEISGIESSYFVGDTISCTLTGEDDTELSALSVHFHRNGSPEETDGDRFYVSGTQAEISADFSTSDWEAGDYEYFYWVDAADLYTGYTGSFSLLDGNGTNTTITDNTSNCFIPSPQYLCLNYWAEYSSGENSESTPAGSKYFADDYYFPVEGGATIKHRLDLSSTIQLNQMELLIIN